MQFYIKNAGKKTLKIIPGKRNHLCPKHQRQVMQAVKNARFMALMPYTRNQTRK